MITVYREIEAQEPVLVAAWPGMGHVALRAAMYLKSKMKGRLFARLHPEGFFSPHEITIEQGRLEMASPAAGNFYHCLHPKGKGDVIVFISEHQPSIDKFGAYAQTILDFAKKMGIKKVITFAGILTITDYALIPRVWCAVTHKRMLTACEGLGLKLLKHGQVSGLNGFLLGLARKNRLAGICFLGELPFFAAQMENPRASLAILKAVMKVLDVQIDLTELSVAGKTIDEEMGRLLEYIQKPFSAQAEVDEEEFSDPISPEEINALREQFSKRETLPGSVRSEIETLFREVQENLSLAKELKEKLDEWQVYSEYEDRFLGLFKSELSDGRS